MRRAERARAASVSEVTQRRLDRLLRFHPDLLARVAHGLIGLRDAFHAAGWIRDIRTDGSFATASRGMPRAHPDGVDPPTAARVQAAADVHAVAQRFDDVVRAAHADLGSIAGCIDAEDSWLARGVTHVRADLVVLHNRLVAVAELAEATIEQVRLLAEEGPDR
jgi:hypothetical protein